MLRRTFDPCALDDLAHHHEVLVIPAGPAASRDICIRREPHHLPNSAPYWLGVPHPTSVSRPRTDHWCVPKYAPLGRVSAAKCVLRSPCTPPAAPPARYPCPIDFL